MNRESLKNNRHVRKVYYHVRAALKRQTLEKKAAKALRDFQVDLTGNEKKQRIRDMIRMDQKYGFTASEYINYRFQEKTEAERIEFVADWEHLGYTCAMNDPRNSDLFDNKWKTYNRFRPYYKREMIYCDPGTPYEDFARFAEKHGKFVIKPLNLSCGKAVQVIDAAEHQDLKKTYAEWLQAYDGHFILEELISQSRDLGKFHPQSVNTVRIPTIRFDDETVIVHPQFRMGQHESVVDNAGAGGVKGAIDVDTGVILSAVDNQGHTYTVHPDSGELIVGYQIPHWDEAKTLVGELVKVVPGNRYTGWDLALTDDGWVLVEANRRAQFGFQMSLQKGFRKEIDGYLARLGKKY